MNEYATALVEDPEIATKLSSPNAIEFQVVEAGNVAADQVMPFVEKAAFPDPLAIATKRLLPNAMLDQPAEAGNAPVAIQVAPASAE